MIGLLIAFAGVVIIASASRTGQVDPWGVALALSAAGLYAIGVLLQKQALATVDPVTVTWLGAPRRHRGHAALPRFAWSPSCARSRGR